MPLAPGAKVTDKVRLVRRLDEGAMGEVWVGVHETLKTEVAVKFISAEVSSLHPESAERFSVEAEAAARIKSPHVVRTFDHGVTEDGFPYIVMELLDGVSLQQMLDRERMLAPDLVAELVRQIGRALDAAHSHGIVHRDIKPHNVVLMDQHGDPFVKVLDFGSAKNLEVPRSHRITLPGMVVGTPEYLSPEAVDDPTAVSHRTDLWALGVVAYKCLTGELPFRGRGIAEVADAIRAGKFRRPSRLRPELSTEVDVWFARVFSHASGARPDSGAEMSLSLDAALQTMSASGRAHPRHRLRERLSYAALALSLVVGAATVFLTRDRSTNGTSDSAATSARASAEPVTTAASVASSKGGGEASPALVASAPPHASLSPGDTPTTAPSTSSATEPSSTRADDTLIDSLAENRVTVPAGELFMGCDSEHDTECAKDERPGRLVHLKRFAIDVTEVTVAMYSLCVYRGGCSDDKVNGFLLDGGSFVETTKCNWSHTSRRNHPMNCVDHHQASTFCRWVGARLPTEAEWEKAARGTDKRLFPWGAQRADCVMAVMGEGRQGCIANGTWPAGSKPGGASPYGALDMAGNVREWVADWYAADYYARAPRHDPTGPETGNKRVGRGGGWGNTVAKFLRTSAREPIRPDTHSIMVGFRCAASLGPLETRQ